MKVQMLSTALLERVGAGSLSLSRGTVSGSSRGGRLGVRLSSGRECVWATSQYLSYANPGEVVDIDVTIAVEGHAITQARAVCHVADREILTVNAALVRTGASFTGM